MSRSCPLAAAGDLDGARVVGRVAGLGDRDDQTPLDRCLSGARYHSIEQVVLVLHRGASGRLWFERVDRRRRPANGCGGAGAIVEAKSAEGVAAGNGLPKRERIGLGDFQRPNGFGMFCDKA